MMARSYRETPDNPYRPTSLDFINRPNPVEPQSAPQRHPLNGTPQLSKGSGQDLLHILLDRSASSAGDARLLRRRTSGDGKSLDLPRLPVRRSTKRLRIPPTLSGLHQPPPDAGILPSISVEQPARIADPTEVQREKDVALGNATGNTPNVPVDDHDRTNSKAKQKNPKRNKWSEKETADLLKGVARFGIGNWTKILKCSEYHFERRTALDLKDRFRVCCPNDYKRSKQPMSNSKPASAARTRRAPIEPGSSSRCERKSEGELRDLGIDHPFVKAKRRTRHDYSASEDAALLAGFQKHKNGWAAIRADADLQLSHRTAMDLRDRMRSKFPTQYQTAGLAPRPDDFAKPARQRKEQGTDMPKQSLSGGSEGGNVPIEAGPSRQIVPNDNSNPTKFPRQPHALFMPFEDPYFGAPFDHDDNESEPITLDRGILDWPSGMSNQTSAEQNRTQGIDPRATLNLPKPTAYATQLGTTGSAALPSLASITAGTDSSVDALELPSLMLEPMEVDGRTSNHFLGFDELLS